MKTQILGFSLLLAIPSLSMAGEIETVWSSENLSIEKDRGSLLSLTNSYKITLSRAAAEDLRDVLNTYVNERAVATALKSRVRHPLGRIFIDVVTYNVRSFKRELSQEGTIGERGIVIEVWMPKAGSGLVCTPPDIFGIQEKLSDAYWAVINPWSWRIKARA